MSSLNTNHGFPLGAFKVLDPEEFRKQAHLTVDFIADYYKNIEKYPVLSQVEPGYLVTHLPENAPSNPEPLDAILKDVQDHIIPAMTHWQSPNFFGYFPATVSTAAILGDMLCTSFNSAAFTWLSSPAATELEMVVMDWLAKLLQLPKSFMFSGGTGGGVIVGTTTEGIICTLIAARDGALNGIGQEHIGKLVVYCSNQTNSSFSKACIIAGILPSNIRSLPAQFDTHFSLSPHIVRTYMAADVAAGLVPIYLCATVGTTSSTAVDPLLPLADLASQYGVWLHVDAAYAGSACICPEFRHYLDGVERADSFSLSAHKWLLTSLDFSCLWVKKPGSIVKCLTSKPEYIMNKPNGFGEVVDYKDWQIGLSRRFRALRLWFVLRSCGVANLQDHIRSDVQMAKMFERYIKADTRFEIFVPRTFSLVCFRLSPRVVIEPGSVDELNRKLLELVNSTGQLYMTHTVIGGAVVLRFAVGTTLTEERHVVEAVTLIKEKADALLG